MAERGWDVTGIDVVEKALRRARQRVEEAAAEVEMRLVHADVTESRQADIGWGVSAALNTGTFTVSMTPSAVQWAGR